MQYRTALALLLGVSIMAGAQSAPSRLTGFQVSALPAVNFNSDEGFGYGITGQAYNYGDGTAKPYDYLIQPLVFFTTKGRRDVSVFFDAPHLLPNQWRLGAYLGREQQLASPYYGIGNTTPFDSTNERPPNPYFYRYGRTGIRFTTNLQRPIAGPLRLLVGVGSRTTQVKQTPFDSGTTLLKTQTGGALIPNSLTVNARAGLVYDTRDRETGPSSGQWIDLLVQRAGKTLGGDYAFTRVTGTARVYVSLTDRLVLAERVMAQNLQGTVPFYELVTYQGSYSDDEALGGSGSVRGWPKNRFIGKGIAFANNELRWRVADFRLLGRASGLILNGFVDAGRVWDTGISSAGLFSDLHVGYGGGARVRFGQDFVVGADVGHSKESGAAIYLGLGYPY